MGSTLQRHLRTYAWLFLAWTVVGVFFFSQGLVQKYFSHDPTPWWHYLATWLTGVYVCALLTPAILWLGWRFPIERKKWPRRVALHLLCSIAFSVIELGLHSVVLPWMGLFPAVMTSLGVTFQVLMILGFHQGTTMVTTAPPCSPFSTVRRPAST